jgi:hypothetical protein
LTAVLVSLALSPVKTSLLPFETLKRVDEAGPPLFVMSAPLKVTRLGLTRGPSMLTVTWLSVVLLMPPLKVSVPPTRTLIVGGGPSWNLNLSTVVGSVMTTRNPCREPVVGVVIDGVRPDPVGVLGVGRDRSQPGQQQCRGAVRHAGAPRLDHFDPASCPVCVLAPPPPLALRTNGLGFPA